MAEKDVSARLRRAVKENNLFLVKRLIQRTDLRNPDPSIRRYTSLAWAAVLGHEETFEYLLSSGHDDSESSKDTDNNTILMLLADQKPPTTAHYSSTSTDGHSAQATLRMVRLYYDRYPHVINWSNAQGKTALHFAALRGNEELVRMLCDLGADYDLTDNKGNTPLHHASSWGHIPVVQLLIERGCQYSARNNEGFTASDYAYSFNTQDTLQDTARLQFESNRRARQAIYAQAASASRATAGNGWMGPPPSAPVNVPQARDFRTLPRMRSGSGTSRTTNTSDSGDGDSNGLAAIHHSQSSISVSSSPSQPSLVSTGHSFAHSRNYSGAGASSSTLSPFATRVLERDADAMEKYLRRNRSGSQGTSSTDNRSQNGSHASNGVSNHYNLRDDELSALNHVSGTSTPKRLRPSMSASQLRSMSPIPLASSAVDSRSRSGTNPTSPHNNPTTYHNSSLVRSSSTSTSRSLLVTTNSVSEEPESYTGPPSQYAQFPDPPAFADKNTTPIANRKMGFPTSSKTLPSIESALSSSHRRGMSSTSRIPGT